MPVPIHEHAADNLRYIREAMERASAFTSIPGWGGVIVGLVAIVATAIGHTVVSVPRDWISVWLAAAVVGSIIGGVSMARKAKRTNVSFTSASSRRFFTCYFAPMVAGAILTLALWRAGAVQPLPAAWLVLYGTGIVSGGAYSIRVVSFLGLGFIALGIVAVFVPLMLGNLLLGAGFGALHVIFGIVIARSYGG
ncbi:MAG TPA: hypothetical protein VF618_09460 [Thermoanaerobaculia bacterium]